MGCRAFLPLIYPVPAMLAGDLRNCIQQVRSEFRILIIVPREFLKGYFAVGIQEKLSICPYLCLIAIGIKQHHPNIGSALIRDSLRQRFRDGAVVEKSLESDALNPDS